MSRPLVLSSVWVLAATGTAMLPLRYQMLPGLALLLAVPLLLWVIATTHGRLPALALLCAVLSLFLRPLYSATRRLMRASTAPKDDR